MSICLRRFVLTSNSSTAAPPPSSSTTSTTSAVLIDKSCDLPKAGEGKARPLLEGAREGDTGPTAVDAPLWRWWPRFGVLEDGCTMKPVADEHRHDANNTDAAAARGLRFAMISCLG